LKDTWTKEEALIMGKMMYMDEDLHKGSKKVVEKNEESARNAEEIYN
jgi:hypothetical protein